MHLASKAMHSRCICTLFVLCWALAVQAAPSALQKPNYLLYHKEAELISEIRSAVDNTAHMHLDMQLHTNSDNYTAELPVVTASPVLPCDHERLRVLLVFGEHAREFVTSELGLYLIKVLGNFDQAENHFLGREWGSGNETEARGLVAFLKSCVSLKIVPIENRGGRQLIERTGDICERKNGNGVDPNRNWGVDWGKREKDYSSYEENAGKHEFSEPEPFLLRDIVHSFRPHVWVNIHTGMEGLFMPFDHQARVPDSPSSQHTLKLLQQLNEGPCDGKCSVGSGGKEVGYLAHGTATDYVYLQGNVKVAMTWEIYGDLTASYMDCFKAFNPITDESFHALLRTWSNAIFELLLLVRDHPDLDALHHTPAASLDDRRPSPLARKNIAHSEEPSGHFVWFVGITVALGSLSYVLLRSSKASIRIKT